MECKWIIKRMINVNSKVIIFSDQRNICLNDKILKMKCNIHLFKGWLVNHLNHFQINSSILNKSEYLTFTLVH